MTASLGSLITFNLTDNVKLKPEPVRVIPASETANMKIAQWISNSGTEPVLPCLLALSHMCICAHIPIEHRVRRWTSRFG